MWSRPESPLTPGPSADTQLIEDAQAWVDDERMVTALRNLVVDAARSSPGSDLTLLLRRAGGDAELGVRSRPPEAEELESEEGPHARS